MKKKTLSFIAIAAFSALSVSATASENIRVVIADNQKSVTLQSPSGLTMEGAPSGRIEKKMIFGSGYAGTRPMCVKPLGEFIAVNGKSYRGSVDIRKKKNGLLLVINDLDVEEYLMGVVAEEIPHDWEFEALKAQAVASRTYALYQKKNAGKRPYHILATVNGQVYSGKRGERQSTVRAVRETEGLVIVYDGEVIPAFYHSSCGGHTENAAMLWGIDAPYLRGVECECQEISKYGLWEKRMSISRVEAALGRLGYRLRGMTTIEIESVTPAGRVKDVAIRHGGSVTTVPAETLRSAMGYFHIPSVFFEIAAQRGDVVFSGRGMGHGVGLCQWGAKEMAQKGHDFKSILSRYYPGTRVVKMDEL